jgi:hypothetical protein
MTLTKITENTLHYPAMTAPSITSTPYQRSVSVKLNSLREKITGFIIDTSNWNRLSNFINWSLEQNKYTI